MRPRRAERGWITVTELADTLVREQGVAFRAAHAIASRLVANARATPDRAVSMVLRELSKDVLGREIVYEDAELARILSPRHFVEVRTTYGGPSPSETRRAVAESNRTLDQDVEWLDRTRETLNRAEQDLRDRSAHL